MGEADRMVYQRLPEQPDGFWRTQTQGQPNRGEALTRSTPRYVVSALRSLRLRRGLGRS